MIKKIILSVIFIMGFIYIVLPGSSSINDFSPIPNSLKSDEPGDTVEVSNVAAYFSQYNRIKITEFYKDSFNNLHTFRFFLPPIILNHPPENAKIYVRDQLNATFLEEYVYPLRSSIFVAGYEPYIENEMKKNPHSFLADNVHINGNYYVSKTTLRFYGSNVFIRTLIYVGIWVSCYYLWKLYKKVLEEKAYA